ncbi:MAG TPA: heparinase II/III family protein [Planctomycetota bacterium]|nr:heparinase II/III family protein [Planctomycetota bacterium]
MRARSVAVLVALLVVAGISWSAEPRHPVLPIAGARADDRALTEFTDPEWLALVPTQSPRIGVPCPVDGKGPGSTDWQWDPHHPETIQCPTCKTTFPSQRLPVKTALVEVLSGRTVQVPYVEGTAGPVLFESAINCEKFTFLEGRLGRLGAIYATTHDERYARIIAMVLDTWADALPHYFITGREVLPISPQEAERQQWFVSRVSHHNGLAHEWPHRSLAAFDAVYDSAALRELSALRGSDVRQHIARDLFGNIGDVFVRRVRIPWALATNLSLPYLVLADAATVLNRPEYITYLGDYLQASIAENLMRDGMYPESFTYHRGYASVNLAAAQRVAAFFAVRPADTEDLKAIKLRVDGQVALLTRSATAQVPLCYPDGALPPFGDSALVIEDGATRERTTSALLPAYGLVALGAGNGPDQTQVCISFNDYANHCHADVLGLTLFAHGQELIANSRYVRSAGRGFNNSTLGHSTVVIDRADQRRGSKQTTGNEGHLFTGGSLVAYKPGTAGIAFASIDGSAAYLEVAQRYQRIVVLNTMDERHPYVLDVFVVEGGSCHDYVLHGAPTQTHAARQEPAGSALAGDHPLLIAGETWRDPQRMEDAFPVYGMIQQVTRSVAPRTWTMTAGDVGRSAQLRYHGVAGGDGDILLGRSPVLGESVAHDQRAADVPPYARSLRPTMVVRRQGNAGLRSVFAGVIEPLMGTSDGITAVSAVPVAGDDPEALAVRVLFTDGRADTLVLNLDDALVHGCRGTTTTVATADGQYLLQGRLGIERASPTRASRAVAIGAELFRCRMQELSRPQASVRGALTGACRRATGSTVDALVTDELLPADGSLSGRWLTLRFGAYHVIPDARGTLPQGVAEQTGITQQFEIDRIERVPGGSRIITRGDHGLRVTAADTTEVMRPQRTFVGTTRFQILAAPLTTDR